MAEIFYIARGEHRFNIGLEKMIPLHMPEASTKDAVCVDEDIQYITRLVR